MANKKNFPVTVDGKEYWISRSCAVCGILIVMDHDGDWAILANKRGPGCPDNVGKWNVPCGYIDFDETGTEAISREFFEETGVGIEPSMFCLFGVEYSVSGRQNITHRYCAIADYPNSIDDFPIGKGTGGEENEVDEVRFIKYRDIAKYDWAFGHEDLIKEVFMKYTTGSLTYL